jgi:hypothetical protein
MPFDSEQLAIGVDFEQHDNRHEFDATQRDSDRDDLPLWRPDSVAFAIGDTARRYWGQSAARPAARPGRFAGPPGWVALRGRAGPGTLREAVTVRMR